MGRRDDVVVGQADDDGRDNGTRGEDDEAQDRRGNEQVASYHLTAPQRDTPRQGQP